MKNPFENPFDANNQEPIEAGSHLRLIKSCREPIVQKVVPAEPFKNPVTFKFEEPFSNKCEVCGKESSNLQALCRSFFGCVSTYWECPDCYGQPVDWEDEKSSSTFMDFLPDDDLPF